MKIIIAGSRYYDDYEQAKAFIDKCIADNCRDKKLTFLSGGCNGADMIGERYARENGYPLTRYSAQWGKYGKRAGPIRNMKMAEDCDIVICFWDGKSRGTQSLISYANKNGVPIFIQYIEPKE